MSSFPKIEVNAGRDLPKIVLLAGFPDNQTSGWGHVLPERLAKDYHLIFLCLPGYEDGGKVRPWGYTLSQLVDNLHDTIVPLLSSPDEKIILLTHDWGAVLSYWYVAKYGSFVSKFITLDIGIVKAFSLSIQSLVVMFVYQCWFAFCYIISQLLGRKTGTICMGLLTLPFFKNFLPIRNPEKVPCPWDEIHSEKCYPYYYLWRGVFTGNLPHFPLPIVPTLYLYGGNKNCMYHDSGSLQKMKSAPHIKVMEVPDAGHWLQISHGPIVIKEILSFIQ